VYRAGGFVVCLTATHQGSRPSPSRRWLNSLRRLRRSSTGGVQRGKRCQCPLRSSRIPQESRQSRRRRASSWESFRNIARFTAITRLSTKLPTKSFPFAGGGSAMPKPYRQSTARPLSPAAFYQTTAIKHIQRSDVLLTLASSPSASLMPHGAR
jgi:hypothetical protein